MFNKYIPGSFAVDPEDAAEIAQAEFEKWVYGIGKGPLEFWLYDNGEVPFLAFCDKVTMDEETNGRQIDQYRVIEFSSYAALKKENENLRDKVGFLMRYYDPADTSFREMILAFKDLSEEAKHGLVDLSKALANLSRSK